MKKIFLSCHFGQKDKRLVQQVESLVISHEIQPIFADSVGGRILTEGIKKRIQEADGLIALMTPRETDDAVKGTHEYVLDEYKYAKSIELPSISMLWSEASKSGGLFSEAEYIFFDPEEPEEAFIKLSKTLGGWKKDVGKVLQAQLLPSNITDTGGNNIQGEYRILNEYYEEGDWVPCRLAPMGEGLFTIIKGIGDDHFFQVKVTNGGTIWQSKVIKQSLPVKLDQQ